MATGSAVWEGTLKEGKGTMRLGSGAFEGAYSFKSRFKKTCPVSVALAGTEIKLNGELVTS